MFWQLKNLYLITLNQNQSRYIIRKLYNYITKVIKKYIKAD